MIIYQLVREYWNITSSLDIFGYFLQYILFDFLLLFFPILEFIFPLKGVFAKNERGYRLNAIKKRFWSLLILLLSVASIRRTLLKTSHTE